MLMAINVGGRFSIEALEFLYLGLNEMPKLPSEQWMVQYSRVLADDQETADARLIFRQQRRPLSTCEILREVEMQPNVDSCRIGQVRSSFGVFHEHHGSHRRDSPSFEAGECRIRRLAATSPIIGVNDQHHREPLASMSPLVGEVLKNLASRSICSFLLKRTRSAETGLSSPFSMDQKYPARRRQPPRT